MATAEERIITALRHKENELGGPNALLRAMHITSGTLWLHVRDGKRRLGPKLAYHAAEAFRDLDPDATMFLRYEFPLRWERKRGPLEWPENNAKPI